MKTVKTFHLVGEEIYSFGRITAAVGLVFILFLFFVVTYPSILSGKIYHYDSQTAFLGFLAYGLFIFFIIAGLLGHKMQKWYQFKIELYDDNWTRVYIKSPEESDYEWYGDIPPDRIVKTAKYLRRYSWRKKNWYVWIQYTFMYKKDAYMINVFGWIDKPEEIKDYDKFINLIKKLAEENRKRLNVKIPPRILWYGLHTWHQLDYANKLYEEREKLLGEDKNDWRN